MAKIVSGGAACSNGACSRRAGFSAQLGGAGAGVLAEVSSTDSICAEHIDSKDGVCCDGAVRAGLLAFANSVVSGPPRILGAAVVSAEPPRPSALLRKAAARLGCESEACLLSSDEFIEFAQSVRLLPAVREQLASRFKTAGPRSSHAWLSDANIDKTLELWRKAFPSFRGLPYAMRDFDSYQHPLNSIDFVEEVRRGTRTFGCVLNTDVSSGKGKHWTCVFVDCRAPEGSEAPWTVEFFDSVGRPPWRTLSVWIDATVKRLAAVHSSRGCVECNVAHQQHNSECGVYALFYIRARLDGVPIERFTNKASVISDREIYKFRTHLFRD